MQHLWGKAPYREGSKTVPPVAGAGGSLAAGAGAAPVVSGVKWHGGRGAAHDTAGHIPPKPVWIAHRCG